MNYHKNAAIAMSYAAVNWSMATGRRMVLIMVMSQSYLDIEVTRREPSDMAFDSILTKMGSGMKQLTDRYAQYDAPVQDPQLLYAYQHGAPMPEANSKHTGGGNKNNAAMSALTLLAFLFFLHILQQCIKDQMVAMSTPQITIMSASREGEDAVKNAKVDKTGYTADDHKTVAENGNKNSEADSKNKYDEENQKLMKIYTAEPPKSGAQNYDFAKDYNKRRFTETGFVNAMDDDFN
ncbi:unnamed protein product [Diatraea saccharalis]|uniref:Uncharacterized protein n=1 Tax=Diatraea saccharalis TaxID=40085 RepID=A0A9N9R242_9NEOP|nr:unnamed protein product [Diatraea saccharalis]